MPETYVIHGRHGPEYARARDCIAAAYNEVVLLDVHLTGFRFAEAVLARLATLDPPMLVVTLDETDQPRAESVDD